MEKNWRTPGRYSSDRIWRLWLTSVLIAGNSHLHAPALPCARAASAGSRTLPKHQHLHLQRREGCPVRQKHITAGQNSSYKTPFALLPLRIRWGAGGLRSLSYVRSRSAQTQSSIAVRDVSAEPPSIQNMSQSI